MSKKNFLLLSLEDKKAKKIANIVNNESCSKILDYLTNKDGTESEIAKELNSPISTVHYNLQQLVDAKLVESDNYHLSSKGKEVKHYSLANKYIIIAPKGTDKADFLQKIKEILPAFGFSIVGALGLYIYSYLGNSRNSVEMMSSALVMESSDNFATKALPMAQEISLVENSTSILQEAYFWFFLGALFTIIIYSLWSYFKNKK